MTNEKPKINPVVATAPNLTPEVPADWALLGMESGYNPKPAEDLRMFIVGPSGEGKTTFLSSIPQTAILDFDDGAQGCPGGRATRIYVQNYEHFEKIIAKFVADATSKNPRFHRVAFDTVDELTGMVKHQLEKEKEVEDITEFGSRGHGYNLILERIWSKILDLEHAGYVWAFNGHMRTKTEVDPTTRKEITKIRESVYPIIAKKILTKADFKVTIYYRPETIEGTKKIQHPTTRRIIEVPDPTKTVTKNIYYLDSLTTDARDNKARGVPTMDRKFVLPLIGGWDVFKEKYEAAVEVEKRKYK